MIKLEYYYTVSEGATREIIINKSRFIANSFRISSEKDVEKYINETKEILPNANHYCYAYILGNEGKIKRFNDDGEPGGTAGMPILQVIEQRGLKDVLVIVTRYFGGIKLGAGGLVRAYSKATAEVLENTERVKMILGQRGILTIDYEFLGSVEYALRQENVPVLDSCYGENVTMTIVIPGKHNGILTKINNIGNGRILYKKIDEIYYKVE